MADEVMWDEWEDGDDGVAPVRPTLRPIAAWGTTHEFDDRVLDRWSPE